MTTRKPIAAVPRSGRRRMANGMGRPTEERFGWASLPDDPRADRKLAKQQKRRGQPRGLLGLLGLKGSPKSRRR